MIKLSRYMPNLVQAAASEAGAGTGSTDYLDLKPVLDIEAGISRVMNNKKLYCRLLSNFLDSKLTEDIIASIEGGDYTKIPQTAHALKGVAANLGLNELMDISTQIELKVKAGETVKELLPTFKQSVAAVELAIEHLLLIENT